MRATAKYACDADNHGEVAFKDSDEIVDIQPSSEDGWLQGTVQRTGHRGLFPAVYAELAPESGDDAVFLQQLQRDGLLTTTYQMEAVERSLNSGHLASANGMHSYSSSVARSHSVYSSTSGSQPGAPPLPVKPPALTPKPASIAAPSGGAQARRPLPPPIPPKQASVATPPPSNAHTEDQELERLREADAARAWEEAHLAKKPTAADASRAAARLAGGINYASSPKPDLAKPVAKPVLPVKPPLATKPAVRVATKPVVSPKPSFTRAASLRASHADEERDAAASWEARHGIGSKAKNQTTASTRSTTESHSKHDEERDALASWEARHGIGGKSKPVSSAPARKPVVSGSKPAYGASAKGYGGASSSSLTSSRSRTEETTERNTTIKSNVTHGYSPPVRSSGAPTLPPKPAVSARSNTNAGSYGTSAASSTTSMSRAANGASSVSSVRSPATENDAPPVPYNSGRAAMFDELLTKNKRVPSVNPATANDAPPVPYSPSRTALVKPVARVDQAIQPSPHHLINHLNNHTSSSHSSHSSAMQSSTSELNHMGDSQMSKSSTFHSFQSSTESSSTITAATAAAAPGGFPLTMSREVKGAMPYTLTPKHNQHHTYTTQSSSSFSQETHQSSMSNTGFNAMAAIPGDAKRRYAHLFDRLNRENGKRGFLPMGVVRGTAARSQLPPTTLLRIEELADRNLNGRIGPSEFNIYMHLVDCALDHQPIPERLPVDLLHSAYA
ncbi:Rho GTPase-activating protein 42 [Coemansia sp. RSA 552]|nr:Rho GTPase-activating protein 42 [Coemansia sp. RSA 552]